MVRSTILQFTIVRLNKLDHSKTGPVRYSDHCFKSIICYSHSPAVFTSLKILIEWILRVKEFCSPNCSMKSGRRNTVENFDLLPVFVEGPGPLSAGVVNLRPAGRYHTLPHHSATGQSTKKSKRPVLENDESSDNKSPPKVPPHQHLTKTPETSGYKKLIIKQVQKPRKIKGYQIKAD